MTTYPRAQASPGEAKRATLAVYLRAHRPDLVKRWEARPHVNPYASTCFDHHDEMLCEDLRAADRARLHRQGHP